MSLLKTITTVVNTILSVCPTIVDLSCTKLMLVKLKREEKKG